MDWTGSHKMLLLAMSVTAVLGLQDLRSYGATSATNMVMDTEISADGTATQLSDSTSSSTGDGSFIAEVDAQGHADLARPEVLDKKGPTGKQGSLEEQVDAQGHADLARPEVLDKKAPTGKQGSLEEQVDAQGHADLARPAVLDKKAPTGKQGSLEEQVDAEGHADLARQEVLDKKALTGKQGSLEEQGSESDNGDDEEEVSAGDRPDTHAHEARYVLGESGENKCPPGYKNILTVSACQAAAQALQLKDETSEDQSHTITKRPKGCFGRHTPAQAYFNGNPNMPTDPSTYFQPICIQATTAADEMAPQAEYIVSSVGTTTCRDGYEYIKTLDECEAASNKLETAGWNGEDLNGHPDRLPYCWIGRAGDGNFNSGENSGNQHESSQLICKGR